MKDQKQQTCSGGRHRSWWLRAVFLVCCMLSAGLAQAQEKRITAEFKDTPLSEALKQLEKSSDYKILFTYDDVQDYRVTATLKNATIIEALTEVLKGKPFSFSDITNGKYISVVYQPEKRSTEMRTISGKVTDSNGEPIIGATVRVVNTSVGTATDIDGKFTLSLPADVTALEIGFVGMKPQLVSIKNEEEINVVMEEDNVALGDVVVTGIFKKAKESYTGAVSTITNDELRMHRGQNLLQTLKNADVSLNFRVNNAAGSNPNREYNVNIRGNSSLPMSVEEYNESASNAVNTPSVILDGFEISLEKLIDYNDEEIESINILKDAAATAIYGSRGSNGVIVVITKQPEPGKLRVNAEVGIDLEVPDLTSYDLLDAKEKLELEQALGLYDDDENPSRDLQIKQIYNERLRRVLSGQTTDWIDKPIRTGVGSHYNIRLEGGSEEFRWSGTMNYKNVQGAMKNSSRRTFNGSITLMYSVHNLIFKNYLTYGMSRENESNYGDFDDYVAQQPYNSPYDEDGNLVDHFESFYNDRRGEYNPLFDASLHTIDKEGSENLTNNFSIEWNILEGLTLRGQFGITSTWNHSDYFLPANHSEFTLDESGEYDTDDGFFRRGRYEYGTGKAYSYSGNVTLSYSQQFNEKHQLYVGLDYSIAEDRSWNYNFVVEGFSNENMSFLGNALGYEQNGMPTGSKSTSRRVGFTGNVNYTYDGRYYVDASGRVDGSSTFGSDKKYAPFWSVGLGWNLHNESFMADNAFVNTLRLKASYGSTGSQQGSGSGASTIYTYATDNKYMNWTGATLTEWGNPKLTWQTTDEFNVGTEIGLWNNRIRAEFDFYTKKTSNLLSSMDLPLSMGLSSYIANVGEVKNRGWEASLNAYIIRDTGRELNWIVSGQLVYDKNWISKLSEAIKAQNEEYLAQGTEVANLFYEGRPQNGIYAVRSLGIDPSTGQEVFLDRDGNMTDIWDAGDKVYLGSADPLYRGNLNTMVMWKGLTFNVSFYYYWGGKTYNQTLIDRVEVPLRTVRTSNVDRRVLEDRWMQPGDKTFFKAFSEEETNASSRFVMDDNVLELSSISLEYRWDSEWVQRTTRLQSITFGVNMNDLFHWSSTKQERGTSYPFARNLQASIRFLF